MLRDPPLISDQAGMEASLPTPPGAEPAEALLHGLTGIGTLVEEELRLPRSGWSLTITRPVDTDALLDRAADDPEQNLPYWSELWPSGIALADAIALRPGLLRGARVLEIGTGLGVTAAAAAAAGAELLAADYAPEALLLSRLNARRNAGREPATLRFNWRQPPEDLFETAGDGFPVLLAADILYEARDVAPLLRLVGRLVAPGGLLWLGEPGRPPAARFLEAAREQGWSGPSEQHPGPWPDPKDAGVVVGLHQLWRR